MCALIIIGVIVLVFLAVKNCKNYKKEAMRVPWRYAPPYVPKEYTVGDFRDCRCGLTNCVCPSTYTNSVINQYTLPIGL